MKKHSRRTTRNTQKKQPNDTRVKDRQRQTTEKQQHTDITTLSTHVEYQRKSNEPVSNHKQKTAQRNPHTHNRTKTHTHCFELQW